MFVCVCVCPIKLMQAGAKTETHSGIGGNDLQKHTRRILYVDFLFLLRFIKYIPNYIFGFMCALYTILAERHLKSFCTTHLHTHTHTLRGARSEAAATV